MPTRRTLKHNIIYYWIPVLGWCLMIFSVSGIPDLDSGLEYDYILRKCAHATEYAVLSYLIYRALRASAQIAHRWILVLSGLLPILYAISDEFHQSFVQGRVGSPTDVLIDSAGVYVFLFIIRPRLPHRFFPD